MRKNSIIGNHANIIGVLISSPSYQDNVKSSYQTDIFSIPELGTGSIVLGKDLFLYSHGTYMSPGWEARQNRKKASKQANDLEWFQNVTIIRPHFIDF